MRRFLQLVSFMAVAVAITIATPPQQAKACLLPGWFFNGSTFWMKHGICTGESTEWTYIAIANGGEVPRSQFQTAALIPTAGYGPPIRNTPTSIVWGGFWRLERRTDNGVWTDVYNNKILEFNQEGVSWYEASPFTGVPPAGMYRSTFYWITPTEDGWLKAHDETGMEMTFLVTPN